MWIKSSETQTRWKKGQSEKFAMISFISDKKYEYFTYKSIYLYIYIYLPLIAEIKMKIKNKLHFSLM